MNIKTILFSKDRAMQLDATLRSFYLHCQDVHLAKIHVLYQASTPMYEAQYRTLKQTYSQISFIREKSFHDDVEAILLSCLEYDSQRLWYRSVSKFNSLFYPGHSLIGKTLRRLSKFGIRIRYIPLPVPSNETYFFFMVDDNLFVRSFQLESILHALQSTPDAIGFSLRLGLNTTYAYMHSIAQIVPPFIPLENRIVKYIWTKAEHDFNYPLEVSSSIYRAAQILPLLAVFPFRNPNTLEAGMSARSNGFSRKFPMLLCFETSVAFCIPVNIVQDEYQTNRNAQSFVYQVEELAQRYERGERINIYALQNFVPNSCHQEVKLEFTDLNKNDKRII